MQCPLCGYEPPPDELFLAPCPECKHVTLDTMQYVRRIASRVNLRGKLVLDVGCGNKGVIGEAYWQEVDARIAMCDIHVLKPSPPSYQRILDDAANLLRYFKPGEVGFITHCGFLEHLDYEKALDVLGVFEALSPLGFFATASAIMRDADAKANADGNPHHRYRSFWDPATLSALGYLTGASDMAVGCTFAQETPFWDINLRCVPTAPWEERRAAAIKSLSERHCWKVGCELEPVVYLPRLHVCACLLHHNNETTPLRDPGYGEGTVFERWLARPDAEEVFGRPPWRAPRRLKP